MWGKLSRGVPLVNRFAIDSSPLSPCELKAPRKEVKVRPKSKDPVIQKEEILRPCCSLVDEEFIINSWQSAAIFGVCGVIIIKKGAEV